MSYPANRWPAGDLRKGVHSSSSAFDPQLSLDVASYNGSTGIDVGIGPRYGMATLPGHADNEALSGTRINGLRRSEGAAGDGLQSRNKVFGIVPVSLGTYADLKTKKNHYFWIAGLNEASVTKTDVLLGATISGGVYQYAPSIVHGIEKPTWKEATLSRKIATEMVAVKVGDDSNFQKVLESKLTKYHVPMAFISVSGQDVPMRYLLGDTTTDGDATHAPNATCMLIANIDMAASSSFKIIGGLPSQFFFRNFSDKKRVVKAYALKSDGDFNIEYSLTFAPSSSEYISEYGYGTSTHIDVDAITAVKDSSGTGYTSSDVALFFDEEMRVASGHKAVLLALDRPIAVVFQEWMRDDIGHLQQYFDLTNPGIAPVTVGNQKRTANGDVSKFEMVPTSFLEPPQFSDATAFGGTDSLALGSANTGVLRANTTYEFTYSYYNKRLNYESNVGKPMLVRTGTNDFVCLQIGTNAANGLTVWKLQSGTGQLIPFDFSDTEQTSRASSNLMMSGKQISINFHEIRFYYRALGTQEWLPAAFFDAAEYWFKPGPTGFKLCAGAIAGLPGGSPGGFIDYSPLPSTEYTSVQIYKNRAFWFSEKEVRFSLQNNVFAYPVRNTIYAKGGTFRGGVVHSQLGETSQSSRLVIFASDEALVARFSGLPQKYPVQVSPTTVAEFDVDGSDLVIDYLFDATAYSPRAAVVAEGVLYWWGPKGVVRDEGIFTPEKISLDQEPWIMRLVDPSKIDEVHCVYNGQTKEIVWFYPPATADGYETHGLILNVITGEFHPAKWKGKIDASQQLKIEKDDSPSALAGERTIVMARENSSATVQRAFFFDHLCRSGDMAPKSDFVVKEISEPASGRRRLTLASGYDAANLATIAASDLICLQQVKKYGSSLTDADDCIATVHSVGADYIDVTLPAGVSWDAAATLAQDKFFPIWHAASAGVGLNGIPYSFQGRYWIPGGIDYWGQWLFIQMLVKLNRLPSVAAQTFDLFYRTPVSGSEESNAIALVDNSDGHLQVLTQLKIGERAAEGQGLKLRISGTHIGSEWVLQSLQAFANPTKGDPLMEFEG